MSKRTNVSNHGRRHILGSIKSRGTRASSKIRDARRLQFACANHPKFVRQSACRSRFTAFKALPSMSIETERARTSTASAFELQEIHGRRHTKDRRSIPLPFETHLEIHC
jgi:hypothetical protein